MARNEIAVRFTEESYSTKAEVKSALKTSLVDNFWDAILKYREEFARILPLKDIEQDAFSVTLTPNIQSRLNNIERRLAKGMIQYSQLLRDENIAGDIKFQGYYNVLALFASTKNQNIDKTMIEKIIRKAPVGIFEEQKVVLYYANSLSFMEKTFMSRFDADYIANLYSTMTNNNELTKLYRDFDPQSASQNVLINRHYDYAPCNMLEAMMDNLFTFVSDSEISFVLKAIAAFYFIYYIKPFDYNNEEIALLVLKGILAKNDIEEFAFLLPIEGLIEKNSRLTSVLSEVQKSNDLTYFVIYAFDYIEKALDESLANLTKAQIEGARKEHAPREATFKETIIEEKVPSNNEVANKLEISNVKAVEDGNSLPSSFNLNPSNIALNSLPTGLDEKDASRVEEHLLEINPRLKRGEAYFLARHCTVGKYYTISQYKKSLGCAYETARTSMEQLVSEGYYRKEMIKNKFIYTPVQKK